MFNLVSHLRPIGTRCGTFALVVWVGMIGGCKNPKLVGKDIRDVETRTVTHYDVELSPEASPKDVVYVLLRAVRDRYEAVQAGEYEKDDAAKAVLVDLAAGDRILENFKRNMHPAAQAQLTKPVAVYDATLLWGPIIAHYVSSFETDRVKATARMKLIKMPNDQETKVYYPGHNDDDGSKAMIEVSLTRDRGYWRIWRVGFAPSATLAAATLKAAPTSQPSAAETASP